MFSKELEHWLDNFSQSAAVDMCEGGDDPVSVTEACLTCVDLYKPNLREEVDTLNAKHGYEALLAEAAKHVRTL